MSPQLTQILADLANSLGGTSNPAYINILNAINSSPDLFNQLDAAASSNPPNLTAITYGNGLGGDMSGTTMALNAGLFTNTDPTQLNNDFVAVMGHEIWHAEDAATVSQERTALYNDGTLSGGATQSIPISAPTRLPLEMIGYPSDRFGFSGKIHGMALHSGFLSREPSQKLTDQCLRRQKAIW